MNEQVSENELETKYNYGPFENNPTGKLRGVAAILAFVLGGFGVHRFYLKDTTGGMYYIVRFVLAIILPIFFIFMNADLFLVGMFISYGLFFWNGIKAIVDGIKLLCMSHEDFVFRYFEI